MLEVSLAPPSVSGAGVRASSPVRARLSPVRDSFSEPARALLLQSVLEQHGPGVNARRGSEFRAAARPSIIATPGGRAFASKRPSISIAAGRGRGEKRPSIASPVSSRSPVAAPSVPPVARRFRNLPTDLLAVFDELVHGRAHGVTWEAHQAMIASEKNDQKESLSPPRAASPIRAVAAAAAAAAVTTTIAHPSFVSAPGPGPLGPPSRSMLKRGGVVDLMHAGVVMLTVDPDELALASEPNPVKDVLAREQAKASEAAALVAAARAREQSLIDAGIITNQSSAESRKKRDDLLALKAQQDAEATARAKQEREAELAEAKRIDELGREIFYGPEPKPRPIVPFTLQGDLESYNHANVEQRISNKYHREFVLRAQKFWLTLERHETDRQGELVAPRAPFVRLLVLIYAHLHQEEAMSPPTPTEEDQEEDGTISDADSTSSADEPPSRLDTAALHSALERDILGDMHMSGRRKRGRSRREFISFPQFHESLFQLIDLWTVTCELDEYLALADSIYEAITRNKTEKKSTPTPSVEETNEEVRRTTSMIPPPTLATVPEPVQIRPKSRSPVRRSIISPPTVRFARDTSLSPSRRRRSPPRARSVSPSAAHADSDESPLVTGERTFPILPHASPPQPPTDATVDLTRQESLAERMAKRASRIGLDQPPPRITTPTPPPRETPPPIMPSNGMRAAAINKLLSSNRRRMDSDDDSDDVSTPSPEPRSPIARPSSSPMLEPILTTAMFDPSAEPSPPPPATATSKRRKKSSLRLSLINERQGAGRGSGKPSPAEKKRHLQTDEAKEQSPSLSRATSQRQTPSPGMVEYDPLYVRTHDLAIRNPLRSLVRSRRGSESDASSHSPPPRSQPTSPPHPQQRLLARLVPGDPFLVPDASTARANSTTRARQQELDELRAKLLAEARLAESMRPGRRLVVKVGAAQSPVRMRSQREIERDAELRARMAQIALDDAKTDLQSAPADDLTPRTPFSPPVTYQTITFPDASLSTAIDSAAIDHGFDTGRWERAVRAEQSLMEQVRAQAEAVAAIGLDSVFRNCMYQPRSHRAQRPARMDRRSPSPESHARSASAPGIDAPVPQPPRYSGSIIRHLVDGGSWRHTHSHSARSTPQPRIRQPTSARSRTPLDLSRVDAARAFAAKRTDAYPSGSLSARPTTAPLASHSLAADLIAPPHQLISSAWRRPLVNTSLNDAPRVQRREHVLGRCPAPVPARGLVDTAEFHRAPLARDAFRVRPSGYDVRRSELIERAQRGITLARRQAYERSDSFDHMDTL